MTAIHEYPGELEFEEEFEAESGEYYEFEEHEDREAGALNSVLGSSGARPLSEQQEYQLANQLLEVSNEDELDHFASKLMHHAVHRSPHAAPHRRAHATHTAHTAHAGHPAARRAKPHTKRGGGWGATIGHAVTNFAHSNTGHALGGILKDAAKEALPAVAAAAGNAILPGIGGAIGGKLGSLIGGLFELEGELDGQELEFEAAKRFVRLGATAAQQAASLADQGVSPETAAQEGMLAAARVHVPAALRGGFRPALRAGAPLPGFRARRPAQTGYGHHRRRHPVHGSPAYDGGPVVEADPDAGAQTGRWVRKGQHIVLLGA